MKRLSSIIHFHMFEFMVSLHNMYIPCFSIGICLFVHQGSLIHSVSYHVSLCVSHSLSLSPSLSLYLSFQIEYYNYLSKGIWEATFRSSVLEIGVKKRSINHIFVRSLDKGNNGSLKTKIDDMVWDIRYKKQMTYSHCYITSKHSLPLIKC